jgi:hypothetical protein
MSNEHGARGWSRPRWERKQVIVAAVQVALMTLATMFRPLAHFGLEGFEERHGDWPELVTAGVLFIVARWAWLHFFRPEQRRAAASGRLSEPGSAR